MNILITGVTGFLGKVVLLDILDKYHLNINIIYLLIRGKKNKNSKKRFFEIYNNKFLNKNLAPYLNKICILDGDLNKVNLGIDPEKIKTLNINIIINNAASVKFNDKMETAYKNNYETTANILNFSEKCLNLKKFIHTSTFYVKFPIGVKNNFKIEYNEIINDIKNGYELNDINEKYNVKFNNSYVLTKFLAEKMIENRKCVFKKNIIRPSIIANSYSFPYPGWNDSYAAYTGFNLSFGTNIVNQILADYKSNFSLENKLNIIPVDYVSNIILNAVFNEFECLYIDAIMDDETCLKLKNIFKTIKYYNHINYNGEYILRSRKVFWIYNIIYDYLPYKCLYLLLSLFNTKKKKKNGLYL